MTTLRSRTIHLAHEQPKLRPYLLPILARTAGNLASALMEQEATQADARSKVIEKYLNDMTGLVPKVESANPVAGRQFEVLYNKVFKEGNALAKSGESVAKYVDTIIEGSGNDDFIAVQRLLGKALSDWKRNLVDHYRGAKSIAASVRLLQAQNTGGYAQNIAKWVVTMNGVLD